MTKNPETITIPLSVYNEMLAKINRAIEIGALYKSHNRTLPRKFAMRIVDGEHAIKVWREYRCLTRKELAKLANVSKTYLSEVESGKSLVQLNFIKLWRKHSIYVSMILIDTDYNII